SPSVCVREERTGPAGPGALPSPGAGQQPLMRGVVIHLNNEQPVVVDLYDLPTARDVAVICTNMRPQDGKRPIFIDHTESVFVIPLAYVRFIELPGAIAAEEA